jgi:hypothetical protein
LQPAELAAVSITGWLAGGAALISYGLMKGSIRTDGVLRDGATGEITPDRVQLLLVAVSGTIAYVIDALDHVGADQLPEISPTMLMAVSASQLLFLIPKFIRRLGSS